MNDLNSFSGLLRRCIDDYHMIEEGDKIAIGISGGKDSLTLLYALHGLKRFYPKKFELIAITLDMGMDGFDTTPLKKLCEEDDVRITVAWNKLYSIDLFKKGPPDAVIISLSTKNGCSFIQLVSRLFYKQVPLPLVY